MAAAALLCAAAAAVAGTVGPSHDPAALEAPRDYSGIRLDRRWEPVDTAKTFGSPTNFANGRLPDDAALDKGLINGQPVNPAAPNEIQSQAAAYGTYLNRWNFTAPLTIVPADQKLQPVLCMVNATTKCASDTYQMMLGGLPVPDDYVPSPVEDTDAEAVFYQPDYVSPCTGQKVGRLYEAWKFRPNPDFDPGQPASASNPKWRANHGGRVVGVTNNPGHYVDWRFSGCFYTQPGHPDSTYQSHYWGVLASGLFIVGDEISREDCQLGEIRHSVGLLMNRTKPGHRWPAQRNDGSVTYSNLLEGMRLRFPADMPRPKFSTELAGMIFDAAQRYGLVISDNTASSVGIRIESTPEHQTAPECAARMTGVAGYDMLDDFPWSKLKVLAVGSDANPTPTE